MADLVSYKKHIPCGIVVSETEESNSYWSKHVPDLYVHNLWTPEITEELIKTQNKRLRHADSSDEHSAKAFAIYDDVSIIILYL